MFVLVATDGGYAKRTPIEEYPVQGRGGKGVLTIQYDRRRGTLVGALIVGIDDELYAITSTGGVIRTSAREVRKAGRQTKGVRLMNLGESATLLAVARNAEDDAESRVVAEPGPCTRAGLWHDRGDTPSRERHDAAHPDEPTTAPVVADEPAGRDRPTTRPGRTMPRCAVRRERRGCGAGVAIAPASRRLGRRQAPGAADAARTRRSAGSAEAGSRRPTRAARPRRRGSRSAAAGSARPEAAAAASLDRPP